MKFLNISGEIDAIIRSAATTGDEPISLDAPVGGTAPAQVEAPCAVLAEEGGMCWIPLQSSRTNSLKEEEEPASNINIIEDEKRKSTTSTTVKSPRDSRDEHEMAVMDNDELDDVYGNGPATPPSFDIFSSPSNSFVVITEASTSPVTTTSFIGSSHNNINNTRQNIKQSEKMQHRVPPTLDLHYITSQIIAMAPPRAASTNEDEGIRRQQNNERPDNKWTQKRRKHKGNDLNELAMFLERRHLRRYLLFNVSDGNDDDLYDLFGRQVVHLPWGSPSPSLITRTKLGEEVRRPPVTSPLPSVNSAGGYGGNKSSGTPSVSRVMDICYALHAYLSIPPRQLPHGLLDCSSSWKPQQRQQDKKRKFSGSHHHSHHHLPSRTVACIYCGNGKTRTGVTIACYLRFCNSVPNSLSGFKIFCERRGIMSSSSSTSPTQSEKDISSHIPPSLRQFFRNFDDVVNMRRFPHPEPLLLRSIQLKGVPVDDMPCVDIWEHGDVLRRRIFSSHEDDGNNYHSSNVNTSQLKNWDDEEGSYTVGKLWLHQDFTLVCRFGGEFASDANDPSKVLFRYVNNPNFLKGEESLELNMADVDMMRRYADSFDEEDFLLTLVFENVNVSIFGDDDCYENYSQSCPERGSRSGRHPLASTVMAKFDGVIQHNERDLILQGWRVLSDAHLSCLSSSEHEFELLRTDLESSIFKLVCPGEHEIDFRSIALQLTNGDADSAKAELIGGLFQSFFSSVAIQRPMLQSIKQLPIDVAFLRGGTSIRVVGTIENDQSSFTSNVGVAVVSPLELGNSLGDPQNGLSPLVEKQHNNKKCVPLVLTDGSKEDRLSNRVGLNAQDKMGMLSSLKPTELKKKLSEFSDAENDVWTHIERGEFQAGNFFDVTNTKELARCGPYASHQSSQRFSISHCAAQTGNKDDNVGMRRSMQSDLRFDAEEHKPTTEIDLKIHDKASPLDCLLPEQSTVGEVTLTTAIIKNIYQPNKVHSRNDESSTKNIDPTGTSSVHYADQDVFTTETAFADQSQPSLLATINLKSMATVGGNDNRSSLMVENKNIESYKEASSEDYANRLLSPLSKNGTAMTDRTKMDPANGVLETLFLDLGIDPESINDIDCRSTRSDNRVLLIELDHIVSTGHDYETSNTFWGDLFDEANDGSAELSVIRNVQRMVEEPQTIPQSRITYWQGNCTATEGSVVSGNLNFDMVVKGVYDCGDDITPNDEELGISVGYYDTADAGLHQVRSVIDNAQEDKIDNVDHRGQITELHDLTVNNKAGDGSKVLTVETNTAGAAWKIRIPTKYGSSVGDEPNHAEEMKKATPLQHDPAHEGYYLTLKMRLQMGALKNATQRDELDLAIMDLDPDKSLESQTVLDADDAASEQSFKGQQDSNTQQTPEVVTDTESPTHDQINNMGCAPSLWTSRLGYPSDWQSLPHNVKILPMKISSRPLKESIYELNCRGLLRHNNCPDYEKYYRLLKMGLLVGMFENQMEPGKSPRQEDVGDDHSCSRKAPVRNDDFETEVGDFEVDPSTLSTMTAKVDDDEHKKDSASGLQGKCKLMEQGDEKKESEPDPRSALMATPFKNALPALVEELEVYDLTQEKPKPDRRSCLTSINKQTPSSADELKIRTNEQGQEAKVQMLCNRAPPSLIDEPEVDDAEQIDESNVPDPRVALMSTLSKRDPSPPANKQYIEAIQQQGKAQKPNPRHPPGAPADESKGKAIAQEVECKEFDPRAVVMAMLNKRSNPTSTREPRCKAEENDVEKNKLDPRAALMAMLSKRAPSAASPDGPIIKAVEHEERNEPDPRKALVSMLRKRAPPAAPVGESKIESSEQEEESKEDGMLSKRSFRATSDDAPMIDAIEAKESNTPDPRAALVSMLSKRGLPVAAVGVSTVESSEQEVECKEYDPRAVVMAMPSKRSNPTSTREPRCKAEENDVEKNKLDPRAALMAMLSKRAPSAASPDGPIIKAVEHEERNEPDPRKALVSTQGVEEVIALMSTQGVEEVIDDDPPLREDPKYIKYFTMLKMGLPMGAVQNAMQRDVLDPSIMDLDPERSVASQLDKGSDGPPLKDDPTYSKYFTMLKMGLPMGAVQNAMQRDGLDTSIIDLDPERSVASQIDKGKDGPPLKGDPLLKEDPTYSKYFAMLKMGLPMGAVQNAMQRDGLDTSIMDLDPERSVASQLDKNKDDGPPLKDDPTYSKYFTMLKMGLPKGAVQNAMQRDGLDPSIMDLDPEKSSANQLDNGGEMLDKGPPLKDDPTYSKYFKMLKMGLPMGAVLNAMSRDGLDPSIIEFDPEKSLECQNAMAFGKGKKMEKKMPSNEPKKPKVKRKKIYWSPIEESRIDDNSLWSMIKGTIDFESLKIDQDEFESLFTDTSNPADKKKVPRDKPGEPKQKKSVQAIDAKRGMNGGIVLARIKVEFEVLAEMVAGMDCGELDDTQLKALGEFLPTKDERFAIEGYIKAASLSKQPEESAKNDLCLCEKYMLAMMKVDMAHEKFECMLFKYQFDNKLKELMQGVTTLINACEEVQKSVRLRKLMAMILMLGNQINTGGSGRMAQGFTLDALLKLDEAKAFDKKTSVLQYLVKLVKANEPDLLNVHKEMPSIGPAENVIVDGLVSELNELINQLKSVKETASVEGKRIREGKTLWKISAVDKLRQQKTKIKDIEGVSMYNIAEPYDQIPMEKFALYAEKCTHEAFARIDEAQENFTGVLTYFGENPAMTSTDFFGTLNKFVAAFDSALEVVKRIEALEIAEEKKAAARRAREVKKMSRTVTTVKQLTDKYALLAVTDSDTVPGGITMSNSVEIEKKSNPMLDKHAPLTTQELESAAIVNRGLKVEPLTTGLLHKRAPQAMVDQPLVQDVGQEKSEPESMVAKATLSKQALLSEVAVPKIETGEQYQYANEPK